VEHEKERPSKNTYCCKHADQGNTCSVDITDEKVRDSNKMLKKLVNPFQDQTA
jgi:hypothetical protein